MSISIPYGAIKRRDEVALLFEDNEFQFLMVRLKVNNLPRKR